MLTFLLAAENERNIAFLSWSKDHLFLFTLLCLSPAILFSIYVCWDDARQARALKHEAAKGGTPSH